MVLLWILAHLGLFYLAIATCFLISRARRFGLSATDGATGRMPWRAVMADSIFWLPLIIGFAVRAFRTTRPLRGRHASGENAGRDADGPGK